MSPAAGQMLLNDIVPKLDGVIARGGVKTTGCEDLDELKAEGRAMAAELLDAAESKGKTVTPGNIAYYTIQALKSGRRFGYAGRLDAMCPAAALDGKVSMVSLDAPIGESDDDDASEERTLHTCLASSFEDPSAAGARELDWQLAMDALGGRERAVVMTTARGAQGLDIAKALGVSRPRVVQIKRQAGDKIREALGPDVLADAMREPAWHAGMRASAERRECRYERHASA